MKTTLSGKKPSKQNAQAIMLNLSRETEIVIMIKTRLITQPYTQHLKSA